MTTRADSKISFKAIDNVSGVVERISSKFPTLTSAAKKSANAMDRLDKSSSKLKQNLSRISGGMKSIGGAMTAGITLPIAALGVQAFEISRTFDKSMNKVQALTGANEKQLASLRAEAKKLGSETSFSASQAADAMAFFGQAGWDTNQILKATGPTLALAAASGTDLAMTADIMSNVMGGFAISADEAQRAADVLAKATAKGNINMEMIGETMKDAAPVAQKYGASLEEVAALTAKLGDAGIQGSKAGTTLKNMFLNLSAPTSEIEKIMTSLGVKAVDPATGKMRKMTDILVDMNKAFESKGLTDSKRLAVLDAVFGKRAIAGAGVLLNAVKTLDPATGKVVNTVAELEKGLINSQGHAKQMEQTMLKGLPGAVDTVKSAFEGMMIAIMDSGLSEFLAKIIIKVSEFFQWISKLNPTILKWGAIIAGIVAAIGPLLFIFGSMIAALPLLISGFNALAIIMPILQIGMIPLLLVMAKFIAIAALVAGAAYLIIENWQPLKAFFVDFFTEPIQQAKDLLGWLGKMTGISSLFGFGRDDVDKKLKEQGFSFEANGQPAGKETGSKELTRQNTEFEMRKQQASVDVKFSNMPKDTRVMTDDRDKILNVDTGMMGAF